jgi:hypothetical protein
VSIELGHLLAELGQTRLELRPLDPILRDRLLDAAEGGDDHLVLGLEPLEACFDGVETSVDLEAERVDIGAQPVVEAVLQLAERAQDVLRGGHGLFLSRQRGRGAARGSLHPVRPAQVLRLAAVDRCPATAGERTDPACPA